MESNVFKRLFNTTWIALLFACCQFAAAAPSVSVTATPNNPIAPASVTLAVTSTSDAEPVMATQVEYFSGAASLGVSLQSPFTLTIDNLAAGTYQITAKVTTTDPDIPVLQSTALTVTVGTAPGTASANFIHTDQLNTPRTITNANGVVVWQWDSDPFGKDAANEQPAGQQAFSSNLRFPGQQFDRESNLHYNYYRDYDPALGRYIQSDPIGLRAGINTYSYVDNSPIGYIDPLGESKVQGQASIGGSDSAIAGITKNSTKAEVDAAIKRAEEIIRDSKASPARKNYLKGWVKVAKRGFTKVICPPFLEDIAMAVARQQCLGGDLQSCAVFQYLGGEIVNPNEI